MSSKFDRQSPIVQNVISVLRQNQSGLTVPEIRRALIGSGKLGIQEKDIETIILLPDFKRLPGGRIILEEFNPKKELTTEESFERPDQAYAKFPSTLRNLPTLSSFVIFDLETNGLDPNTSDFFQLSAIKVIDGQPCEIFNQFAKVDLSRISRALQVKLHFDELQLHTRIENADQQQIVVDNFIQFLGDLPLLAHNGTFDYQFLTKHAQNLQNPLVDTLELFILAFPTYPSHSIENLAKQFGYEVGLTSWIDVTRLDNQLGVSASLGVTDGQALFHSAIFDCLILFLLIQDAFHELRSISDGLKFHIIKFIPNLENIIGSPEPHPEQLNDLSDLIPMSNWRDRADINSHIPLAGLDFSHTVVNQVYRDLTRELQLDPRPSQDEMIQHVTAVFQDSGIAMMEAPTGTGKTYAYLIPALTYARATGQQVIISTSTKTLQDQILRDLDTKLKPHEPFPFSYAVLKGQENYLCLNKLWETFQESFLSDSGYDVPFEEKLALIYFMRFAAESDSGDLQGISYWFQQRFPIVGYLKASLCSEGETCNHSSSCYPFCFHPRAVANAHQADLLIINHTLLLMRHWPDGQPQHLILDEAHNLEDVATNAFTEEVSRTDLELLLNRLLRLDDKRGALVIARRYVDNPDLVNQSLGIVRKLRPLISEFGGYLKEFIDKVGGNFSRKYGSTWRLRASPRKTHYFAWQYVEQIQREILRELISLQKAIFGLIEMLQKYQGPDKNKADALGKEFQAIFGRLFGLPEEPGLKTLFEEIPQVGYDPLVLVHWFELTIRGKTEADQIRPENINWSMKRAPVRVGAILDQKIYKKVQSLIMTSATLTLAEGGFNFFLDRLGLSGQVAVRHLIRLSNVFSYDNQVMLGMPGYLKSSARYDEVESFQKEIARELDCLFRFTEGRGLVLHTARSRMEFVAQELENSLTHLPVYWQREGASTRLLQEEFTNREESILLGLRSFWEGIDVPGPSLSYLAIEKLPFPVPTEPIIEARRDEIHAQGGNEWMDYLIPIAALHFKQGFGRLMRKHDDRGVVFFLDKRLRIDASYREAILGSLPGYKRTDDMIGAEENREDFYKEISHHMAPIFPDLESRIDFFPCIREDIIPDIERILSELEIPTKIPKEEYHQYRDYLIQAAQQLIDGFVNFRDEQDEAMQSILSGTDTLVVLPTGSGKSLTFQLPALLRKGVTVVFSPLIALMRDQVDKLRSKGISIVDYIVSGQSGAHRDDVYRRMAKGQVRLVYIAPERIRDPALTETLQKSRVIQVVVDEAHCVHMWGNSFRPDFLNIPSLFRDHRAPFAALTATATKETQKAIINALEFVQPSDLVTRTVNRPELKFIVYNSNSAPERISSKQDKWRVLLKILGAARKRDEVALVYTSTVREAEKLSRLLNLNGFSVRHYHGRLQAQARDEVQQLFREGIIKIIVATKAFGMGIDKSDVRYVIHYDIPGDIESYFQEAGRAGRDRQAAYCILLYHKSDLATQQYFIQSTFPDDVELNTLLGSLRSLTNDSDPILIRPDDLADESGIDIERLDLALHLLERLGFIHRSYNFSISANLLLNRSVEWIHDQLSEDKKELFKQLVDHIGISDKRSMQIDLLDTANEIGNDPLLIDRLLLELSSKGWAVYRPWDRGYILEPLDKLVQGEQAQLAEVDINQLKRSLNLNLKRVMRYAESLGKGDCRRDFILKYFGEKLSYKPETCCNLCNPIKAYPWSEISAAEISDVSGEIDPLYITLRAVEWNHDLFESQRFSPYTESTLTHILTGNSFAAVKFEEDPIKKAKRAKRLEGSPYFGVLQGIKGGNKTVRKYLDKLGSEGYITAQEVSFKNVNRDDIFYRAPILTQKGKKQILSGKYILSNQTE
jgi:ATP-dependent DNA helicase RecQ